MAKPQAEYLKIWQQRLRALNDNADEVKHLETRRDKLQSIHDGALIAYRDQATATAAKQEASRRLEALLAEGRKVDTFLTTGLREHYGDRSEKLAEFKLQPFRGRRSKKVEEPTPPPETNK